MTKIYTYCLFDHDNTFYGVYSSLKAIHRDAMKLCNKTRASVVMESNEGLVTPSLTALRNQFKGRCDIVVQYRGGAHVAKILKTKLRE
tara:strand:+ start:6446 stop:6709 length:264 start_codon:yes stop_codon:yes gene_type:complete